MYFLDSLWRIKIMPSIICSICEFKFHKLRDFDFIHWNEKHVNTREFKKKPICEACIHGIVKQRL